MSATTYFGDVVTTGNTNVVQNLEVFGPYAYFSNIVGGKSIGTLAVPFGNVFASSANTTILNTASVQVTNLISSENVFVANAYQGANLFAIRLNTSTVSNTLSLIVGSNVGIGTKGGANLTIQGNVVVSNAATTGTLYGTTPKITGTLNTNSIVIISNAAIGQPFYFSMWAYFNFNGTADDVAPYNNVPSPVPYGAISYSLTGPSGVSSIQLVPGSYVSRDYSTPIDLEVTGGTTAAAWIRFDSSLTNGFACIFALGLGGDQTFGLFYSGGGSPISARFRPAPAFGLTVSAVVTMTMNANRWYHVAISVNASTQLLSIYVNGVLAATQVSSGYPQWPAGETGVVDGALTMGTNLPEGSQTLIVPTSISDLRIYDSALSASSIQVIYNQNGIPPPDGYSFQSRGNTWVSNGVVSGNVYATSLNATTTNTGSVFLGSLAISTALTANTASVLGNVFVSNSVTTPNVLVSNTLGTTMNIGTMNATTIIVTGTANVPQTMNTTTLNVLSVFGQTGVIGINTSTGLGANIQTQGNVFASNALSGGNLTVSSTIYYNEDITNRSIYLLPSTANASVIQSWISATCNAASQPSDSYWCTSAQPVYGNVVSGAQGNQDFFGSVLLPDGRVMFVPCLSSGVGIFNPFNNTLTVTPYPCANGTQMFKGGVLLPNGNVLCIPTQSANAGLFNPLTYAWSNIGPNAGQGAALCVGGVLTRNGNVVCIPFNSSNVIEINPNTNPPKIANVLTVQGQGSGGFQGGVLLPNGNVVFAPYSSANIGMYNPTTNPPTFTNVGPIGGLSTLGFVGAELAPNGNVIFQGIISPNVGVYNPSFVSSPISAGGYSNIACGANFQGGVTLPNGNVIMVTTTAGNVGLFDTTSLVYSNSVTVKGGDAFRGGTLLPSGQVVFTPFASLNVGVVDTFTPAPQEFCLSPYFNKF